MKNKYFNSFGGEFQNTPAVRIDPTQEAPRVVDKAEKQLAQMLKSVADGTFETIPFARKLKDYHSRDDVSVEEFRNFATQIYSQYIASNSFPLSLKKLQTFVTIGSHLVKMYACFSYVLKAVMSYAALQMFSMPLQRQTITERFEYVKSLATRYSKESADRYGESNLGDFLIPFYIFTNAIPFSMYVKKQMRETLFLSDADALEFKNESDRLCKEIRDLQDCTLKQSYYVDPLTHYGAGWAIVDPRQAKITPQDTSQSSINHVRSRSLRYSGAFAEFVMMIDTDLQNSLSKSFSEVHSANRQMSGGSEYSFAANDSHIYHVDLNDGEIYYQLYPVRISLREVFAKMNAEPQYQFLRLTFLARLADMVLPRVIVDSLPALSEISERVRSAKEHASSRSMSGIIIQDFIVPRRKILKNKEALAAAHQQEKNAYANEEKGKSMRQFFGRVGHPRRLAKGYHPHSDAKKWAKEDGFWRELEDNETWCRPVDSPVPVVHRQKSRGEKRKEEE